MLSSSSGGSQQKQQRRNVVSSSVNIKELASFSDQDVSSAAAASSPQTDVRLLGKVVMVRSFAAPRPSSSSSPRKMTYVTLADADGRSILVVYFVSASAPDAFRSVGRVLLIGPVDIKDRDPLYDGSKNGFTAYAHTIGEKRTICRDVTDLAASDLRVKEIRDSNKYFPAVTKIRDTRMDERHILVPAVLKRVIRSPPESRTLDLEVADEEGDEVIVSVDATSSSDGTDVYSLDVRREENDGGGIIRDAFTSPGTVLLLSDFKGDVSFSDPDDAGFLRRVSRLLVSTPSSRMYAARNPAITERLLPLAERIAAETGGGGETVPSCIMDITYDNKWQMLRSYLPSVYDGVLECVNGRKESVVCVVDGIVPSYSDMTRLKCPNDFRHSRFETCDPSMPGLYCTECGGLTRVNRHFDASVLVRGRHRGGSSPAEREEAFVLKLAGPCVSKCFFGNISADAFEEMSDEEKTALIERVGGGRIAVMRVWCKSEGNKIVMDAYLLAARADERFDGQLKLYSAASVDDHGDDEHTATKKARLENASAIQF